MDGMGCMGSSKHCFFWLAICFPPPVLHLENYSTLRPPSVRSRDIAKKAKVLGIEKTWEKNDMVYGKRIVT